MLKNSVQNTVFGVRHIGSTPDSASMLGDLGLFGNLSELQFLLSIGNDTLVMGLKGLKVAWSLKRKNKK